MAAYISRSTDSIEEAERIWRAAESLCAWSVFVSDSADADGSPVWRAAVFNHRPSPTEIARWIGAERTGGDRDA